MGTDPEAISKMKDRIREHARGKSGPRVVKLQTRRSTDPSDDPPVMVINASPMGAPRMNRSDAWRKRPVVMRYFSYKDEIKAACKKSNWKLRGEVRIEFQIPMPQSWSSKRRTEMAFRPHENKPDIDNLIKGYMDSFGGGDQHVHTITATKVWAEYGAIVLH